MSRDLVRRIRAGVIAARTDYRASTKMPSRHRDVYLADMIHHAGYLQGDIPRHVYTTALTRMISRSKLSERVFIGAMRRNP